MTIMHQKVNWLVNNNIGSVSTTYPHPAACNNCAFNSLLLSAAVLGVLAPLAAAWQVLIGATFQLYILI